MARRLLLILPALAVCIVLWVALDAGGPVQVSAVQLLGGPTRGVAKLSLLVRAFTLTEGRRFALPGRRVLLTAQAEQDRASWAGALDEAGYAEATLEFSQPLSSDPLVRVEELDTRRVLGEGTLSLDARDWRSGVRRNGGWLPGQTRGELHVQVAAGDGAMAVPFETELWIQVSSGLHPAPAEPHAAAEAAPAELSLELEGAELSAPSAVALTTREGAARVRVRPLEHAISLRVIARSGQRSGEWYGALPVIPGALHSSRAGERLVVRSPIQRDRAFVSWVTERARLGGAIVPLTPDPSGGAAGAIDIPEWLRPMLIGGPSWTVVASEYDKRSPGVVGWPATGVTRPDEPPHTFDVADRVLLDGTERALASDAKARRHRRRVGLALMTVVGLGMGGLFWYEVRARRRGRQGAGDGEEGNAVLVLASARWVSWVALACIILGLTALAYFGMSAR